MKFRYNYIVQYQDIDDTRRLRLHTMENRLLIVAGKVADEMGIGIPFLAQYNSTWIITHVNLEMLYLPTHGEELIFETWIEMNAHMLSVRDPLLPLCCRRRPRQTYLIRRTEYHPPSLFYQVQLSS